MQTTRRLTLVLTGAVGLVLLATGCDRPQSRSDAQPSGERAAEVVAPDSASQQTEQPAAAQPPTTKVERTSISTTWGAKHTEGIVEVELRRLDEAETKQVSALFGSNSDALAYSAAKMPSRFRDIEALDVLTPQGPVRLEIAKLVRTSGPSRPHYWLHTEPTDELADSSEHKLGWTLATPAGEMADTATMRPAEPKPVHAKAAPKLRQAFLAGLEADQRARVAEKLEDEHIEAVSARFPAPHAQVVTINVPDKPHMPLAQAAFIADGTGNLTYTAKDPFVGPLGYLTILAVADPDGDEIDGVLYRMDTDGYFIRWMHFDDDGNVVINTLAGFSA